MINRQRVYKVISWTVLVSMVLAVALWQSGLITAAAATYRVLLPVIVRPPDIAWPMAGANPQRTSWSLEEVRGSLRPLWYKPIEPYIAGKVQIIAANGLLYISTARGLYALDADTGAEKWVYPTELPLGHSPTIDNGVAYVGGLDHKLYAVDALTGHGIWTFEATQGFQTNPLVANQLVYVGNRDGYMYAVYSNDYPDVSKRGTLAWKYKTNGPILFSAALSTDKSMVFFASNDSFAYALNAQTGALVWKSAKLPGAGFSSFWPVVYEDKVIFAGSENYRSALSPGPQSDLLTLDMNDVYPNRATDPNGTPVGPLGFEPGNWAAGTLTLDASRITNYLQAKPWRRTYFVLNQANGLEYTFPAANGQPTYAPILWHGTHSGTRYPPVVGQDNVLYQTNNYQSNPYIPSGQIAGWKIGTPFISIISPDWLAVDEPTAYSAGGNLIYFNHVNDREAGAIDISIPNRGLGSFGTATSNRQWTYFAYNLQDILAGYNVMYDVPLRVNDWPGPYGGPNGIYASHVGDQNAPVPYRGKVYIHRSNAIIAWGTTSGEVTKLPVFKTVAAPAATLTYPTADQLKQKLTGEVQKILTAGHLRPGYGNAGLFNWDADQRCGENYDLMNYWHNPADTIYALLLALPYLPVDVQAQAKTYIQTEFTTYPPYTYSHVGWRTGASREAFDLPPEVQADLSNWGPSGWPSIPPYNFYVLWKYAQVFGGAKTIFDAARSNLASEPGDSVFTKDPFVLNSFIAGYIGYLNLQNLAGYPQSSDINTKLNRLLALRASSFSKDTPYARSTDYEYSCRTLTVSRNFMFLVPELAQYLQSHALSKVQAAVDEYSRVAPYWFVAQTENAIMENTIQPLYDVNALFAAKAMILGQPREELLKYLDVPGTALGDVFYIQNLVSAIAAPSG